MGLLVGIGLGGTAISIPMSIVGKHFPQSNRTIAMSISYSCLDLLDILFHLCITAYSLVNNGGINTLIYFCRFIFDRL